MGENDGKLGVLGEGVPFFFLLKRPIIEGETQ